MNKNISEEDLKFFVNSYIETALWASTDDAGVPLDAPDYADYTLSKKASRRIRTECLRFIQKCIDLNIVDPFTDDYPIEHDFWLTRNGHGAGFWDGDYPKEMGERLTDLAKSFGECHLLANDGSKTIDFF